jgi:FKBP-type peptidyl-prolyl cis-trans isomerase
MPEGSVWQIFLPPALDGEEAAGRILPGAVLVVELKLVSAAETSAM